MPWEEELQQIHVHLCASFLAVEKKAMRRKRLRNRGGVPIPALPPAATRKGPTCHSFLAVRLPLTHRELLLRYRRTCYATAQSNATY